MAPRLIGAGFGRTGTLSIKTALERLGVGTCYHMFEVMAHPDHAATWIAAARGETVDWDAVLGDYGATVDWPACEFWAELLASYPDAKVLLSVRPPQRWYDSFHDTILEVLNRLGPALADQPEGSPMHLMGVMVEEVIVERSFGGTVGDEAHALEAYRAHNEAVVAACPPDRLLVYDVAEGWGPLCRFLDLPVPPEDFPNVNDRAFFRSIFMDETADEENTP